MKQSKKKVEKKKYNKPEVKSAKIYERLALACAKVSPATGCRPPLQS